MGVCADAGIEITELSTHLQGQLVAVHPAYDLAFDGFADPSVHGNPAARQVWAVDQVKKALSASKNLGLTAMASFSGALAWPYVYPWPQRPAGLVETAFDELARRWQPILDHADACGVDICYEIHPGEDLHDGVTFEMFLERVNNHPRANMLYDPSHYVLQCLDYLDNIDIYQDRIKMFHVKDAEFNPTGRQGVYSGYQTWVDRAGRFRSLGDGQVDFKAIFSNGTDAFIGQVHRTAARLDNRFELIAGALSSTTEKSRASGEALGLPRVYDDFKQMAVREARLKQGIEAVAVVAPNHVHYPASVLFLRRGVHVICDKPMTSTLADAKKLVHAAQQSSALFILTHNYTAYPMIRQAREMIAKGEIGKIRLVQVEYAQDWMTVAQNIKQAEWRSDPERSGEGGAIGDIGTHAYNLACFVTGLTGERLAADLQSFVPGRKLDDNAHVMLRFTSGARGMLWCSQVAPGNENALRLRIYGETGGLEWAQEDPNYLWHTPFGEPKRLLTRNGAGTGAAAGRLSHVPAGHPEGYLDGFANIYGEAAEAILAQREGRALDPEVHIPDVHDGFKGVKFVSACVKSSQRDAAWVKLG